MTTRATALWLVLLPLFLAACSGATPTSPTSPTATDSRILLLTGSLQFNQVDVGSTVTKTFAIGNTGNAPLTVTSITGTGPLVTQGALSWSSGTIAPGSVQEVTVAFHPVALGSYAGALMVSADHTAGTNIVPYSAEVVPGTPFAATWSGNFRVDRCIAAGSVQDLLCSPASGARPGGPYPVGKILPMALSLAQSGDAVTGTLTLGDASGAVTGTVANGLLTLRGAINGGNLTATTVHWSSRVIGRQMEGLADYQVTFAGMPGTAVLQTTLVVNKQE